MITNEIKTELGVKFLGVRPTPIDGNGQVVALAGEERRDWINGIFENAYAKCKFIIAPNRAHNKYVVENLTMDYRARNNGLKFRKITANSMAEAQLEFIKWIEKNKKFFDGTMILDKAA